MIDKFIEIIRKKQVEVKYDEYLHEQISGIIHREIRLSTADISEEPFVFNRDLLSLVI